MENAHFSNTVYINARSLSQPLSGMQRYTEQLITALDHLIEDSPEILFGAKVIALTPNSKLRNPSWKNIAITPVGKLKSHAWDQVDLFRASRKGILISLAGTAPLLHKRNILALHDANVFANPDYFSRSYRILHQLLRPLLAKRAKHLITISEFSRAELSRYCNVKPDKFTIIPNSAEHMLEILPSPSALKKFNLTPNRYFLCVGNLSPNKNIATVINAFESISPEGYKLAIAGGESKVFSKLDLGNSPDVHFLGRIDDSELSALYKNAAAFVFPSFYEGFGVPPLEAMTMGCPVISSNTTAMPEILGNAALFFDPNKMDSCRNALQQFLTDKNISEALKTEGFNQANLYKWQAGAEILATLIRKELRCKN